MIQIGLDGDELRCTYPEGERAGRCGAPATRTLDTGMGVVAACPAHQNTNWWQECKREAMRALAEARKGWFVEPPARPDGAAQEG